MNRKLFSIVVPVFQNQENLHATIPQLLGLAGVLTEYRCELVLVDDGSTDESWNILQGYATTQPHVIRLVKLTRNFGQTPAIQAGLAHSRGDCVGIISADLQESPEVFTEMLDKWRCGARFVIGERVSREENRGHTAMSNLYWKLIRLIAFRNFPSMGYDLCLLDRQVVRDLNRINEKNSSIFVLIYWLGYRPVSVPVHRSLRQKGKSQWNFWSKVSFTVDTLIGFSYLPARMITYLGVSIAFICGIYILYLGYNWVALNTAPPGWMTVVGLVTFLGATSLFSIGIVSEYLLRVLDEVRKRPPYVVDQTFDGLDHDQ